MTQVLQTAVEKTVGPAVPANPTPIHVNVDRNYVNKDVDFHFKKDKTTGVKRNSVKLALPAPTPDKVVSILETGGKPLDLLLDCMFDVVTDQARAQVNDNETITQDTLDLKKLDWDFIANLPKAERRGGGISKEIWDAFAEDYIAVMPSVTGKTAEQVGNAAKLLLGKFQQCKTNKKVISFLRDQLALWFQSTPNAEEYQQCYEFLDNKADVLLKMDEAQLLANL